MCVCVCTCIMHACYAVSIEDTLLFNIMLRLCTCLDWDKDGDVLAITQEKNGQLV